MTRFDAPKSRRWVIFGVTVALLFLGAGWAGWPL